MNHSLHEFFCSNPSCGDCGKKGCGNIGLYTRYGRKQVRLLICRTCGKTFSELNGTVFWDSRLDWETIFKLFKTLLNNKKMGIRAAAKDLGLSKNTVKRYLRLAAYDLEAFTAMLVAVGTEYALDASALEKMYDDRFSRYRHVSSGHHRGRV